MNGYIITEEMIKSWRKGCVNLSNPHTDDETCKLCKHRGKGMRMDCCDFDDEDAECLFRSHPYNPQAERDKVLNIIRPQVLYFALRMEEKLRKHDKERGSRGWVGYTQPEEQEYLLNRLIEEVDELKKDVKRAAKCGEPLVSSSPEWTDVGNMAMMGYTAYYGDDTCISMINYMMKELRQEGKDGE